MVMLLTTSRTKMEVIVADCRKTLNTGVLATAGLLADRQGTNGKCAKTVQYTYIFI